MPTNPDPVTLAEVARRAAEVVDPADEDSDVADLLAQFEDADEPIAGITDELIWLRDLIEEPTAHGFETETGAAHLWWPVGDTDTSDTLERLKRLRERGILDAAGFLLHDESLDDIDLDS